MSTSGTTRTTLISPFQYFADPTKARPIFNGFIYIGRVDGDPTNPDDQIPIQLICECGGTPVNVTQPVRTGPGGLPIYNGQPAQIVVCRSNYSITLQDKDRVQVYHSPNVLGQADNQQITGDLIGLEYGDVNAANRNLQRLRDTDASSLLITMSDDLYVAADTINDSRVTFDNLVIEGDLTKTFHVTTGGSLFVINNGGSFCASKVRFSGTSSYTKLVASPFNMDTRLKLISFDRCEINGYLTVDISSNSNNAQDPSVFRNGIDNLSLDKCIIRNNDDIALFLRNAMYDKLSITDNVFHNCRGLFCFDTVVNESINYDAIVSAKVSLLVSGNEYTSDLGFINNPTTSRSSLVGFILTEGHSVKYSNNHVENLVQTMNTGTCCDIYMGSNYTEMSGNQCWNRFNFSERARTAYTQNVGLKIKKGFNVSISDHTHAYRDGFFETLHSMHGLVKDTQVGDFFSIEHSIADGPAYILNMSNCYIESAVLNNVNRNAFAIFSQTIKDCTFLSDDTGFSNMINANLTATQNTGRDSKPQLLDISGCGFYLPNTERLRLCNFILRNSGREDTNINITNNSGVVKNLQLLSTTNQGNDFTIGSVILSNNSFECSGTVCFEISEFAQVPTLTSLISKNNNFICPAATSLTLGTGVTASAINLDTDKTVTINSNSNIIIDTFTGKNGSTPMFPENGTRLISGTITDRDSNNIGRSFDFSLYYRIDNDASADGTTVFVTLADGTAISHVTNSNRDTGLMITTDHPTARARIICVGNTGVLSIVLGVLGTDSTNPKVINTKIVKI